MVPVCAAVILIARSFAAAEPLDPKEGEAIIARFVEQQQQTRSYQAGLKQSLRLRGLREPVESTGRIYYQAPDSLALLFSEPPGEYLIISGSDLYLKKSGKRLQRRTVDPKANSHHDMLFLLAMFRDGARTTREHFHVEMSLADADLLVHLTPKDPDPKHRQPIAVDNWLHLSSLELRRTTLTFYGENTITYEFVDPVRNQKIDPKVFAPAGKED